MPTLRAPSAVSASRARPTTVDGACIVRAGFASLPGSDFAGAGRARGSRSPGGAEVNANANGDGTGVAQSLKSRDSGERKSRYELLRADSKVKA